MACSGPSGQSSKNLGFTLTEIMLAAAALAIMMLMFSPMFSLSQKAFTALEVSSALKDAGQKALNPIAYDLNQCKKLYKFSAIPTSNDSKYLANVLGQLDGMPQPMTGFRLPSNNVQPVLSPEDTVNFRKDFVGNGLLLASLEGRQDLTFGGQNIRLDIYHFSFYYLAEGVGDLGGKAARNLWEWHSVNFADFNQLSPLAGNVPMLTAVIAHLTTQGIQYAWDPSANYDAAFHSLGSIAMPVVNPTPAIDKRTGGPAVKILVGTGGGSYRYGVSPNTGPDFGTKHRVPIYADEAGEFPSGFEVVMAGPTGSRMVFVRLVLIAKGDQKITYSKEHVLLVTTQDLF